MIFHLSFFIFSLFLSYIDCTKLRIPNITLGTLFIFLLLFGYMEEQLNLYSFAVLLIILIFFVIILLAMPKMILGGGDIKYILVIAVYLEPLSFPIFLLVTGFVQMLFLIYFQKIKKRKVAPMAPAIMLSVIIVKINELTAFYVL